jgi:cation diffusion facilitator CzcD-associated flavoprotein CzcO
MPNPAHSPIDAQGLEALEARLSEDLRLLCYPGKDWVPRREGVTDVVIIGGGMCGMVAWLALKTGGINNMLLLDRAPEGREGPWLTYARMETLRSPKELTGPAFGHGALTFQAWFRAQFGTAEWQALDKIPRPMWMEYLRWYRKVLDVPVENGVSVDLVEPEGDLLRLHLSGAASGSILARKLVFATGRDGTGKPNIPAFVGDLPRRYWAHSADEIDFAALRDKRVAVIGVGASAVDNAAEALEHGAREVRHLIRRKTMPTINKMMGIGSFGFTAGYAGLGDEWRWRLMQYSFATQTPPPHGSTLRVSRHENAHFHFGKAVNTLHEQAGAVRVGFEDGTAYLADFIILGTGFTIDPMSRTEFGAAAGDILLWHDVYTPPAGEQNADLGRFPYLNPDFTFREKEAGTQPWLGNVYCFNYGASASLGKVSGDIPGISEGAAWLARALAARLYAEDVADHWQTLQDYAKPELDGSEWTPSALEPLAEKPVAKGREVA